ncbi:MAG: helical backbone metal receptor, partial [Bacteroidota bacterium]
MPMHLIDQMNRNVQLAGPPQRIISTVPSQTELLAYLGLNQRVVGITKYCVHPPAWQQRKPHIGGTKKFRRDQIAALQPDLIIGNKEENEQTAMESLMANYPVWMSDIENLADALEMIAAVGQLTQTETPARLLCEQLSSAFGQLNTYMEQQRSYSAAYFIW